MNKNDRIQLNEMKSEMNEKFDLLNNKIDENFKNMQSRDIVGICVFVNVIILFVILYFLL